MAIQHHTFDVFTKSGCPECVAVKTLLKSRDIPFTETDISDDTARQEFYAKHPGVRSMPQVFVDGQRVGGMAGLRAALAQIG